MNVEPSSDVAPYNRLKNAAAPYSYERSTMSKRSMRSTLTVSGVAIAATMLSALSATLAPVAQAGTTAATPSGTASTADAYFAGTLLGKNEVPTSGGPAVGDKDGKAVAVVRIRGNEVSYAVRWEGTDTPTAFHIHQGKAGKNGDVKVGFFMEALPGGSKAILGSVRINDGGLLAGIRKNPKNWYLNLHTAEFPGGAVRAQMHRISPTNLSNVLAAGVRPVYHSNADGRQEVPVPGKKVGDPNGRAEWLVGIKGSKVYYATIWEKLAAPTNGHIHRGKKGKNGDVVIDFFADSNGLPKGVTGIAGTASVKPDIARGIKKNPKNWYTNLHTTEFGGGAVRGQLYRSGGGW
ncbi:CHRD domain-containing protein [Streptosporangium sp. NPDC049046]|uniref:CHRD domain-containing protein n=1 Tax=Streptosporangium sp. NPDC049046 TaxID=3155031 RepID=UPI00341EF5ED